MMKKPFNERFRILITWFFAAGMFGFIAVSQPGWEYYPVFEEFLFMMASLLAGIGALGRAWCAIFIVGRKDGTLVRLGPYATCRNPLYFFSFLGAIGIGLATETIFMPCCIAIAFSCYYPFIIRNEEKRLRLLFGEGFEDYQREVPCFFPKFSLLKGNEPKDYPVCTKTVRHCLCEALWFVWLIGIIELLAAFREVGCLPTCWLIY